MNTLVVLLGPTGVGKTEVALQIAEHLQSPIINADSRQIYAEIPIGTAAPTKKQQERIKHYFVGTLHLTDYYSAAKYEENVLQLLNQHFKHQQVALLSGGSMMYIDAVCQGIDDIPTVDEATRKLMKRRLETEGLDALVEELKVLDPEHYKIVDLHNPRRVIHALEICHMTGNTYTSYRKNTKKIRPFNIVKIGLNRPREEMYERINNRVLKMMEQDIPPYVMAGKEPIKYAGINIIGLRRRGFSNELIQLIHQAYRLLYSKGVLKEGIEEIRKNLTVTPEIQYIIDFVESSQRGIIR